MSKNKGLRPEWMVNTSRIKEIRRAIEMRLLAGEYIQIEWIAEYNRRLEDALRNEAKKAEEKICADCICRICEKNGSSCQGCDSCLHGWETTAVRTCEKYEERKNG